MSQTEVKNEIMVAINNAKLNVEALLNNYASNPTKMIRRKIIYDHLQEIARKIDLMKFWANPHVANDNGTTK